jgi:hypothetical protein
MWTPEVHGHVDTRRFSAPVDVDLHEVFDEIGAGDLFGLMGHFDVRYERRYAFFVDAVHVWSRSEGGRNGFGELTVSTKTKSRTGMVQFGPAYRFLEMETREGLDAQGIFSYRLPWKLGLADVSVAAGYRAIEFDRDTGSGAGKRSTRLMLRGPLLGVAFVF